MMFEFWRRLGVVMGFVSVLGAAQAQTVATASQDAGAAVLRQAEVNLSLGRLPDAMRQFKQSADAGNVLALARLGDMMRFAEYNDEAIAYYQQATEKGHPAGMVGLAYMYGTGLGVKKDETLAVKYAEQAREKGWWDAYDFLARAYQSGELGLAVDLAKAKEYAATAQKLHNEWRKANDEDKPGEGASTPKTAGK